MRKLLKIKLIALLLLPILLARPAFAGRQADLINLPTTVVSKFAPVDFVSGSLPEMALYMYNRDEVIDLAKRETVRFAINSQALYKSKEPYASFQIDLFEILPNGDRLFISSQSLTRERKYKQAAVFNMNLNRFDTNYKNLEIDIYDTDHKLINTYKTQVSATNLDAQGQAVLEPIAAANCDGSRFDECHLDYIFSRLVFEAKPQTQISTRVIKGDDGNYTVTFPITKAGFSPVDGTNLRRGSVVYGQNTLVSNGTLFISANGTALHYNEPLRQLEFMFPGYDGPSGVLTHDGHLALGSITTPSAVLELPAGNETYAPLKFNPATLMSDTQNGAVEYDGHRLFVTVDGVRQALAFGSEVEASRQLLVFRGNVTDDQLPSLMEDKTFNNVTINGNLSILGGSPADGKFLATDDNGNTFWDTPTVPSVDMDDILGAALNGYAINGMQATIQALSSTTTLINGIAMIERNAQLDRTAYNAIGTELDAVVAGLAAGTVEVDMAGEITGENNGTVINGLAMYAKQLKRGHSAGLFTAGAGTVTNGDTLLGALQKMVGNTNTNTANIATNTSNITTIQSTITNMNGDVTGSALSALSLNGLALFAKQLKVGHSAGTFTPAAGTVTNGDSILGAFQKIVGNVNENTSDIADLNGDVADLLSGANGFGMAGEITGQTDASVINGLALYAKQLKLGHSAGLFTAGAGTVSNGDTLLGALQKIVGNINTNTSNITTNTTNIATNTASIASHATTLTSHTSTLSSHASSLSNLINGDQAIPISGDLVGYTNGVVLNGFAIFDKELKTANGLGLFTAGPGGQALNNGDTLIEAIEKLAGNIDATEADIVTNATQIASHAATLASHTTSISTLTRDISDLENGDSTVPLAGELGGTSGAATINGISMFTKQLKSGVSTGLFTAGAGTVTNGDSLLGALQKIVGNVNTNTSDISSHATTLASHTTSISTLTRDVSDIENGDTAIPMAGAITGTSAASSLNGIALFAKQLKSARSTGLFTPGAGAETLTNGDTIIQALEKIAGNVDQNEEDISNIANGGIMLAFNGEVTGYVNGAIINGLAMYSKPLSDGHATGLFSPGAGNQTVTNADTLHSALQKLAGNIDLNESDIASHATTLASHTTSIAANAQNISDLANGDDAFTEITLSQTGNSDVLLANNGGLLEANGIRVLMANQVPGIDPEETVNITNGTAIAASVDYSNVDGAGTDALAIKLTSDRVGGQTITLNLALVGADYVPTSYVINGVQTSFATVPDSLGDAFTVPGQDYKLYVSSNKIRLLNVDPFSGLLTGSSFSKKSIRIKYRAFTGS